MTALLAGRPTDSCHSPQHLPTRHPLLAISLDFLHSLLFHILLPPVFLHSFSSVFLHFLFSPLSPDLLSSYYVSCLPTILLHTDYPVFLPSSPSIIQPSLLLSYHSHTFSFFPPLTFHDDNPFQSLCFLPDYVWLPRPPLPPCPTEPGPEPGLCQ